MAATTTNEIVLELHRQLTATQQERDKALRMAHAAAGSPAASQAGSLSGGTAAVTQQQRVAAALVEQGDAAQLARDRMRALVDVLASPEGEAALLRQNRLLRQKAEAEQEAASLADRTLYNPRQEAADTKRGVATQLAEETRQAERAGVRARALTEAYADPKAAAALQKNQQALKELARLEEQAARQRRRAEVGGLAEGLEQAQKKLGAFAGQMDAIAAKAGTIFAGMSAGILGLGALGDGGVAVSTLSTSFQLLGQAVGEGFLPYIMDAAGWIQRVAQWFSDLDESTKGTIARILVFGTAIAGGIYVMTKLYSIGAKLADVLLSVAKSMANVIAKVSLFAEAQLGVSRWVSSLTMLGGVVGGLIGLFGLLGSSASKSGEEVEKVGRKRPGDKSEKDQDDTRGGWKDLEKEQRDRIEKVRGNAEQMKKVLADLLGETQKEFDRVFKAGGSGEEARFHSKVEGIVGDAQKKAGGQEKEGDLEGASMTRRKAMMELVKEYEAAGVNKAKLVDLAAQFSAGSAAGGRHADKALDKLLEGLESQLPDTKLGKLRKQLEQLKKLQRTQGAGGEGDVPGKPGGPLLDYGRMMPNPGMYSGSGYGEHLQMASLQAEAGGDAKQQLLAKQLNALEELLKNSGRSDELLRRVADNTDAMKKQVPAWGS